MQSTNSLDDSVDYEAILKSMKIDDPNFQDAKSKACYIFWFDFIYRLPYIYYLEYDLM